MKITSTDAQIGVTIDGERWLVSFDTITYGRGESEIRLNLTRFNESTSNPTIVEKHRIGLLKLIPILRGLEKPPKEDKTDDN